MPEPLVIERITTAAPSAVYDYLTNSTSWVAWQGSVAELDPVPGGIFRMEMPDGRTARGQYVELQPYTKVAFTWGWTDMPGIPPAPARSQLTLSPPTRARSSAPPTKGLGKKKPPCTQLGGTITSPVFKPPPKVTILDPTLDPPLSHSCIYFRLC